MSLESPSRAYVGLLGVALLILSVLVVPSPVAAGPLQVTEDTVLAEDVHNEIVIGADHITLDCAGHSVVGEGSGWGISLSGRINVTVRNCHVTDFDTGIRLHGSSGNLLQGNRATGNAVGLQVSGDGNLFRGNRASGNHDGFLVGGADGRLRDNEAVENTRHGFVIAGDGTGLRENRAGDNGGVGFLLLSSRNVLVGNIAGGNGHGVSVQGGSVGNLLRGNRADDNTGMGFHLVTPGTGKNKLEGNSAEYNGADGFYLGETDQNLLLRNSADYNGEHGFHLDGGIRNRIVKNAACWNQSPRDAEDQVPEYNGYVQNNFCN